MFSDEQNQVAPKTAVHLEVDTILKPQMNTDERLSFFPESLADLAFSNIPQRLRKETVELNRSPMGIVSANWSGKLW